LLGVSMMTRDVAAARSGGTPSETGEGPLAEFPLDKGSRSFTGYT